MAKWRVTEADGTRVVVEALYMRESGGNLVAMGDVNGYRTAVRAWAPGAWDSFAPGGDDAAADDAAADDVAAAQPRRECADCGKPAHDEECAAQRRANRAAAPCYAHGGECAHGGEACELSECRPCLHPDAWPAELQARLSTRTTREDYLGVLKEGMDWQWRGRSGDADVTAAVGERP